MIWIYRPDGRFYRECTRAEFYRMLHQCRLDGITDAKLNQVFVAIEVSD